MTSQPLDLTCRRILQLLAADGRASYQAIADEIGLSRPAVMERVKRLEEAGLIQGYHATLDRAKCGFPVTAFVAIRFPVSEHAGDDPQIQLLAGHPNVLECHHVAGDDCYVLKVAAPSIESLEGVLRQIKQPGQPVSTRTTIVLSTLFEKPGFAPVEAD
jgi:Lrp/AsnC family leucine-responsive transcriptional regulator